MLSILAFIESENINGFLVLNLIIRLNLDFTFSQKKISLQLLYPIFQLVVNASQGKYKTNIRKGGIENKMSIVQTLKSELPCY